MDRYLVPLLKKSLTKLSLSEATTVFKKFLSWCQQRPKTCHLKRRLSFTEFIWSQILKTYSKKSSTSKVNFNSHTPHLKKSPSTLKKTFISIQVLSTPLTRKFLVLNTGTVKRNLLIWKNKSNLIRHLIANKPRARRLSLKWILIVWQSKGIVLEMISLGSSL